MQGNGAKILITLAFLGMSLWYLFPTFQYQLVQREMAQLPDEERVRYEAENFERIQNLRERSLSLGLDLQGGMHVTLEIRMDALVRALADEHEVDDNFDEALRQARARADAGADYIDSFVSAFQEIDPDVRLSRYFRASDEITRRSSNAEVSNYLHREAREAITRAMSIVRDRVDRFGVAEPSIQRQGARRIVVEMPGIDDPERIRELLRGTARLEFRLMADPEELRASLSRIINFYENGDPADQAADPADAGEDVTENGAADEAAEAQEEEAEEPVAVEDALTPDAAQEATNPLLEVMQPVGESVIFGHVLERDTARVNALLRRDQVQAMLPAGIELMYSVREAGRMEGQPVFELLGVRSGMPELTGEVVTDARPDFDESGRPIVSLTMNREGAQIWSRLTGANVGRPVAIVMDGVVYSFPRIIDRISGGRTQITGVTRSESEDIVVVLKSGALPAPVDIVEERVVGPSLGEASIRAGTISVIAGLLLVAFFMVFYYHTAGFIANLALLLNIVFIFGILAGFGATLTLPGIAGIVLTIGMAVDANVLIFDRIREEMRSGRTLKAAIDGGYSKALSAIADANITTFFVAIILFSFGIGPIQGFAVTLMAGILSSLFTAIIVTRIVFDYLVAERRGLVALG